MNLPWTSQSTNACARRSGSHGHISDGSMYAAIGALKPRMLAVRMPKSAAPRRQSMTVMRSLPGTGPIASGAGTGVKRRRRVVSNGGSVGSRPAKGKSMCRSSPWSSAGRAAALQQRQVRRCSGRAAMCDARTSSVGTGAPGQRPRSRPRASARADRAAARDPRRRRRGWWRRPRARRPACHRERAAPRAPTGAAAAGWRRSGRSRAPAPR